MDQSSASPIPEEETPVETVDPSICPRCNAKLTDPDGLGWCSGCGFCRSLEEEGKTIAPAPEPAAPAKPSLLGASEFGEAMRRMPSWSWPILVGVLLIAIACVAGDYLLPELCLARALWSAIQIVLSVVGIVAAQLWGALLVGTGEERLGARDVFLPGRIWKAVCQRLPETRKPLWLGSWCLTGFVCAVALIGGFEYWLDVLTNKHLRDVAASVANDTARSTAKDTAPENKVVDVPALPVPDDKHPVTQCVVIGYRTEDGVGVTSLVLAAAEGDNLSYAGTVRKGISPELRRELRERSGRLERPAPLVPGLKMQGITWVNPGVFCDVIRISRNEVLLKGVRD